MITKQDPRKRHASNTREFVISLELSIMYILLLALVLCEYFDVLCVSLSYLYILCDVEITCILMLQEEEELLFPLCISCSEGVCQERS